VNDLTLRHPADGQPLWADLRPEGPRQITLAADHTAVGDGCDLRIRWVGEQTMLIVRRPDRRELIVNHGGHLRRRTIDNDQQPDRAGRDLAEVRFDGYVLALVKSSRNAPVHVLVDDDRQVLRWADITLA
jgi:hypothetical protein